MRLKSFIFLKSLKIFISLLYTLVPSYFYFFKTSVLNKKDFFIYSNKQKFFFLINFFKNSFFFKSSLLNDISVIDFLKPKNRFKVVYNLSSLNFNTRIFISSFLERGEFLLSLGSLFKSSNWLEREVWDMFGIIFKFHHDLRRILTDYGFRGFPLRKDFPLSGYVEVRFDEALGDIVYEPLELSQELRFYNFSSGWEKNY